MDGVFVPLATGQRVTSGTGGRTWQPLLAHLSGERGLFFDEHRTLSNAQRVRRATSLRGPGRRVGTRTADAS
jgi:hypothetical protein